MHLDPTPLLRTVIEGKRLEAPLHTSVLSGNIDRRTELRRDHWRVQDAAGRVVKVTAGANLKAIRAIAEDFHTALPRNSPATLHFFQTEEREVWVQKWIEGASLEEPVRDISAALETIRALDDLEQALASTAQPSSSSSWREEYDAWSSDILHLPVWTSAEKNFLSRGLLPLLRVTLSAEPTTRWSNGDFISANIKRTEKSPVLLDFEHGKRTHFYREDYVRFLRLSPVAHQQPGLFSGIWPETTPAWEAFFQLRQLALELATNTAEYLLRVVPQRKANLRFVFQTIGPDEPTWSASPRPPPPEFARETVQLFWKMGETWTESESRRVEIRRGDRQFVAFRLPSASITSLRLDPTATERPSVIHALRWVDVDGKIHDSLPAISVAGAKAQRAPEELRIFPDAADPQLLLCLSAPAKFVVAEISVLER